MDKDGNLVSIWSQDSQAQSDEDVENSSSDEDEDNGQASSSAKPPAPSNDREVRKAQKKARQQAALAKQNGHTVEPSDLPSSDESDDADMPVNPNHSRAAQSMTQKVSVISGDGDDMNSPPSRREREAIEAAAEKQRYQKLQAQGKTDEAKADMARLKIIREQREAEAARRQVRGPSHSDLISFSILDPSLARGVLLLTWWCPQAEKEEKEEQDKTRRAEMEARDAKRREAAVGPKKKGKKK